MDQAPPQYPQAYRPPQQGMPPAVKVILIVAGVVLGLLVLLVIVGALAFMLVADKPDEARWEMARTDMGQIHQALNQYALEHDGEYPTALSALRTRYFPGGVPKDSFTKADFTYRLTPDGFELVCLGKDQKVGGDRIPNKDIVFTETGEVEP